MSLGAAAALIATFPLVAASPARWEISSAADWLDGRSEQVAVDRDGRITLGPALTVLHEDEAPSLWDVVVGPDGRVYAGTGNDGRVVVVGGSSARTLFDSDELQMHALAWHDGALLAASSPSGQVYRIAPDGTSRTFFDPEDGYIWALAVGPDDEVYVATGNKARVHRVDADGGNPRVVFESAAANVTALAVSGDHLLVGTENPGRLYRVPRDGGRAFALMDGPHTQVQAIRPRTDGTAYVLAVSPNASASSASSAATSSSSTPTPVVTTEVSIVAIGDSATSSASGSGDSGAASSSGTRTARGKGTIYHLSADGLLETFWDVPRELPFDIAVLDAGTLLLTAEEGAVYRLDGNPVRASRLGQTASQQVTRIAARADGFVLAGANPGKLYALAATPAPEGTYTSKVRDAGVGATWGLLHWEGDAAAAQVAFETRSGNTGTPDDTWAEWTAPRTDAGVMRVASPAARYLQWRVVLTAGKGASAPVLDAVTVTYLATNRRPQVSSVTVHPPGLVFQQPFGTQEPPELAGYQSTTPAPARDRALSATSTTGSTAAVGRRLYQKGFQTLQWDADDPDEDDLRYKVLLRRVGTDQWQEIARDLVGTVYTWDTTQQADGRYVVRVVATDGRANPADRALQGERERGPFIIDNAAPAIAVAADSARRGEGGRLRLTVTDEHSPLSRVDVLGADGTWRPLFPEDGLLDGLRETFVVDLASLGSGPVVVRASDSLANIATASLPTGAATENTGR